MAPTLRPLITTATIVLTIIGTAIALASVIVPGQRAMRHEMNSVRREIGDVSRDLNDLRERMARLEGLFEGFTKAAPSHQSNQI